MSAIKDFFNRRAREPSRRRDAASDLQAFFYGRVNEQAFPSGYRSLADCPEVQTAIMRVAQMISIMSIRLKRNSTDGDTREHNRLERLVDIEPVKGLYPRQIWIQSIVEDMLIHGNAYVQPITREGLIDELRKLDYNDVVREDSKYGYTISVCGRRVETDDVLNFPFNPDPRTPWKGRGLLVLPSVAKALVQARETANGLRENPIPSIIVRVNGLTEELRSDEGRDKFEKRYLKRKSTGAPWIVPGEAIDVKDLKPLSIKDLAIPESMTLDTKLVAAIVGVTPYMLGVDAFNRDAHNNMVATTLPPITQVIEQVLTAGILHARDLHFVMDYMKLMSYDPENIRSFMYEGMDRGAFSKNEARAALGYEPIEGGDVYVALENYIPADMAGKQKKLQEGGNEE